MFYLLAHGGTQNNITVQGIGITEAMWVMYYANVSTWRPTSLNLVDAFKLSVEAANDLYPYGDEARQVTRAWGAVKVCDCPHQGDIVPNGFIDVSDVLQAIKIAFLGYPEAPPDPQCLTTRANVDNIGLVDVFDVVYIIKTAFADGPNPVNPCAP